MYAIVLQFPKLTAQAFDDLDLYASIYWQPFWKVLTAEPHDGEWDSASKSTEATEATASCSSTSSRPAASRGKRKHSCTV